MNPALQSSPPPEARSRQSSETLQLVSFHLADEEYAVQITQVREIVLMAPITRVPQAPNYVQGLINLRNMVIPVFDLRLRFGMPRQEPTEDTRIVVVSVLGRTMGLVVDAVSEVFRIGREQIAPPPSSIAGPDRDFLKGLAKVGSRLVILLDLDQLMDDEEPA